MTDTRNWRDAKIPQWVKDQIYAEVAIGALTWPTEAEPEPLPFSWGAYDSMKGEGHAPGHYWGLDFQNFACPVFIRHREESDTGNRWDKWRFSSDGVRWNSSVIRGPLYATEREANLAILWRECRKAAKTLYEIRQRIKP
jgi:hypothetical protein